MGNRPRGRIMPGDKPGLPTEQPLSRQVQEIEIPENNNAFTLKVANRKYVTVLRNGQEIKRDESAGDTVKFNLPPGKYTIVTDGEVEDVQFETVERRTIPGAPVGESRLEKLLKSNADVLTGVSPVGPVTRDLPGVSDIPKKVTLARMLERNAQPIAEVDIPALVDKIIEAGRVPDEIDLPSDILDRIAPDGRVIEEPVKLAEPTVPDVSTLPPRLLVTVEAFERHPIDDLPMAKADGKDRVTIYLDTVGGAGKVISDTLSPGEEDTLIYVRATGGAQLNFTPVDGLAPRIRLKKGKANFTVTSSAKEHTLVTISFLHENLPREDIQIHFYPPVQS